MLFHKKEKADEAIRDFSNRELGTKVICQTCNLSIFVIRGVEKPEEII